MEIIARSPQQLGDALRRFREKQKLTQRDVSERVTLRQATISSVEAGGPGTQIRTLTDILRALELELVVRPRQRAKDIRIEDLF